jgi:hypothetical protein
MILLISASQVARTTGMSHQCLAGSSLVPTQLLVDFSVTEARNRSTNHFIPV